MWTWKVTILQRPSEACRKNLGSRHQWWHANLCTHGVSDTAMCPVVCVGFNHSGALHIFFFFWFIQATFVDLLKHAVRKLWRAMSHHPCVQICCFHAVQILESSRMPLATTDFARGEKKSHSKEQDCACQRDGIVGRVDKAFAVQVWGVEF